MLHTCSQILPRCLCRLGNLKALPLLRGVCLAPKTLSDVGEELFPSHSTPLLRLGTGVRILDCVPALRLAICVTLAKQLTSLP